MLHKMIRGIDVFVYVFLGLLLCYTIKMESTDLNCENAQGGRCGVGFGMAYAKGRPEPHDTFEILLEKVRTSVRYELNGAHWRRCFILATIVSLVLLYFLYGTFPTGPQLLLSTIVIYTSFYVLGMFYQKNLAEQVIKQVDKITHQIQTIYEENEVK